MPGHTSEQCRLIQGALCWVSHQPPSLFNTHPSTHPPVSTPMTKNKQTKKIHFLKLHSIRLGFREKGPWTGFRVVQTPPLPLDVTVHLGLPEPYIDLYLGTPCGVVVGWSPNPLTRQSLVLQSGTSSQPPGATQISIHKHRPDQPSHAPSGVFTPGSSSVCSPLSGAARMRSQITPFQGRAVALMPGLSVLDPARGTVARTPPHSLFPRAMWI